MSVQPINVTTKQSDAWKKSKQGLKSRHRRYQALVRRIHGIKRTRTTNKSRSKKRKKSTEDMRYEAREIRKVHEIPEETKEDV